MSSYLMKPPSKERFVKAGAVKGKGMMKPCPTSTCGFSLLTRPRLTYIPTTLFTSSPPFPSALFLAVPSGEEASLSLHPHKHLGGPGKAVLWGDSHRSLSSGPQSRYKARNPARPPHAASPNRPFQTNPCCLRGIRNTTWAALSLPLPHYCLCIVYILYIYI